MKLAPIVACLAGYLAGAVLYFVIFTIWFQFEDALRLNPPRWGIALILACIVAFSVLVAQRAIRAFSAQQTLATGLLAGLAIGLSMTSIAAILVVSILWWLYGNSPGFYVG